MGLFAIFGNVFFLKDFYWFFFFWVPKLSCEMNNKKIIKEEKIKNK